MTATIGVPVATVWSGPDAPRRRDALAVADRPDVARWVSLLDRVGRQGLHGRVVTQALAGEPAEVLAEQDQWVEVVLPWQPSSADTRGYRGWVRRSHLTAGTTAGPIDDSAVVVVPSAAARNADVSLSYGTILPVAETGDTVHLRLPDGAVIAVDRRSVRVGAYVDADPGALLASARQFVGLQYLWGGTCAWGLDCSGYVHLAHRVVGVTVPRDAFDQVDARAERDPDHAGPGDLYFFARTGEPVYHVGFATTPRPTRSSAPTMMHAPEGGERVEDAPLAPHRADTLVSAGTFLPDSPS